MISDWVKHIDGKGIFPIEGKRLALIIGVNASTKSSYRDPLKYAERDAYEMAIALESSACNFTLLKPALQGKEATTRDVKDAVIELITESTPQDFLCFYFSGHAQPMKVKGESQDIYLVTHDFNESQVEIDPTHHLSMRWLWEVLYQRTNVGKILVILDCCYAGNMLAAGPDQYQIDLYKLFKNYFEEEDAKKQTDRSRFILSATGYDAVAHERDGHGIMTGLLLKALRGEFTSAYDEEGYLDISALYTYLLKAMPEQPPSRSNEGRDRFILAWRRLQSQNFHDETRKSPSLIMTEADFWKRFEETSYKLQRLPLDHTLCRDASLIDINEEAVISLFQKERVQKQSGFRLRSPLQPNEEEVVPAHKVLQ